VKDEQPFYKKFRSEQKEEIKKMLPPPESKQVVEESKEEDLKQDYQTFLLKAVA
jgi:hypothetical protein